MISFKQLNMVSPPALRSGVVCCFCFFLVLVQFLMIAHLVPYRCLLFPIMFDLRVFDLRCKDFSNMFAKALTFSRITNQTHQGVVMNRHVLYCFIVLFTLCIITQGRRHPFLSLAIFSRFCVFIFCVYASLEMA